MRRSAAIIALLALAACGGGEEAAEGDAPAEALALDDGGEEAETVEDIEVVEPLAAPDEGATPMAERVAVLGILNKRNGLSREIRLQPGESARVGDVVVRLRACETTAPWEPQRLTGAFVQVFVREAVRGRGERRWSRVFSGWLFKERPALNVVQHRLYDVWPMACEMTHPGRAPSAPASNARSRASSEAPAAPPPASGEESESPPAAPPSEDSAESSIDA